MSGRRERTTCAYTRIHAQARSQLHTHTCAHDARTHAHSVTHKRTRRVRILPRSRTHVLPRLRVYALPPRRTRLNTRPPPVATPTRRTCTRRIGRRPGHVSNRQRAAPGPRRSFGLAKILRVPRSPRRAPGTTQPVASTAQPTTDLWWAR